jgi:hypothetical protein
MRISTDMVSKAVGIVCGLCSTGRWGYIYDDRVLYGNRLGTRGWLIGLDPELNVALLHLLLPLYSTNLQLRFYIPDIRRSKLGYRSRGERA